MKNKSQILLLLAMILPVFGCSNKENTQSGLATSNPNYPGPTQDAFLVTAYPALASTSQALLTYPGLDQSATAYPGVTPDNGQSALLPDPPITAPEPKKGLASMSGALYSIGRKIRLSTLHAYLTPGTGENKDQLNPVFVGPRENMGDISFFTDANANFEVNNIPPGKYFLIIWAPPYSWSIAQISETNIAPLLIDLQPDEGKTLGVIYTE